MFLNSLVLECALAPAGVLIETRSSPTPRGIWFNGCKAVLGISIFDEASDDTNADGTLGDHKRQLPSTMAELIELKEVCGVLPTLSACLSITSHNEVPQ